MKKVFSIFFSLFITICFINSQNCNCDYVIAPNVSNVDNVKLKIQPGDTVCIQASTRRTLRLANFNGTPEKPIVFMNYGGEVIIQGEDLQYGIGIVNSSFIQLTGTGFSGTKYGIRILKTMEGGSMGIGVGDRSTNFEIDHIEIANVGFAGIMAKTDPKCDLSVNRGNFTQFQTIIHDNYIHNTGGEGLYIGHSFYSGRNATCNGEPVVLFPSVLKGVRIYNNLIDSAKWDGIQIGSADEDCEIYNNKVLNYGIDKISGQNSGIQMGGGTTGKCYNNVIQDGNGNGIAVFGNGNIDIYNNLIVNPGKDYVVEDISRPAHGIFVDNGSTLEGSYFNIFNNSILNPKTDGIRFQNNISVNNNIYNNIIVNPGSLLFYVKIPSKSPWINMNLPNVVLNKSNNLFEVNIDSVHFVDHTNYNFRLLHNSPAIDNGFDVSGFGVEYDHDYNLRPQGNGYDIGAYEYISDSISMQNATLMELAEKNVPNIENLNSTANLKENDKISLQSKNEIIPSTDFEIYPNPSYGQFKLIRKYSSNVNIIICDVMGNIVYRENNNNDLGKEIDISRKLDEVKYFITLTDANSKTTKSILINDR